MMRIALVADDLTGAADSGAQFARAGYQTAVFFHEELIPDYSETDVVVADTDSRALDEKSARERVFEAAAALKDARIFYKKLDSTLRGPVAAELGAALRGSGRRVAVVAPAFPDAGRTTRDGVQMVHGVPVHRTDFAEDPVAPVHQAHIPTLLADLRPISTLGVRELADAKAVREAIENAAWIVADAEADEHLETLVRAVGQAVDPSEVLWAGSAGLAGALAEVYPGPRRDMHPRSLSPVRSALVVAGSMSEATREQIRTLREEPDVVLISLDARRGDSGDYEGAVDEAVAAARKALAEGWSVALNTSGGRVSESGRVADALAAVVSGLVEEKLVRGLVMTGGETAVRASRGLGARGILIVGELEEGVPMGTLVGPEPLPVITKAGGFGKPDTLVRAVRALTGGNRAVR